jgi:hypothetical protein
MSFLVYLFVLVVAASSVVFGLDWMQAPLQPPASAGRLEQAQGAKAAPGNLLVKTSTASAGRAGAETTAAASTGVEPVQAPAAQEKTAAAPLCDISACERAYRTFSPADCTYQPYDGPRRVCTRGNPPRKHAATLAAAEAHAQAGCNVSACSAAYQSFDSATCTYQPYDGARRLCTK